MTSPAGLFYNSYYHIFNRGNNGENIFLEEKNYAHFLNLLVCHISPIADIFAYCLLKNHFHLLIRVRSAKETARPQDVRYPSRKFSDLFNAYAKAINRAYSRSGSLFQHPFGRVPVTDDRQFWNVIAYIHQNPQKHKFVDDFRQWKYSSYGLILGREETWLKRDMVLDWFGGREDYVSRHEAWVTEWRSRADED